MESWEAVEAELSAENAKKVVNYSIFMWILLKYHWNVSYKPTNSQQITCFHPGLDLIYEWMALKPLKMPWAILSYYLHHCFSIQIPLGWAQSAEKMKIKLPTKSWPYGAAGCCFPAPCLMSLPCLRWCDAECQSVPITLPNLFLCCRQANFLRFYIFQECILISFQFPWAFAGYSPLFGVPVRSKPPPPGPSSALLNMNTGPRNRERRPREKCVSLRLARYPSSMWRDGVSACVSGLEGSVDH